MTFDFSVESEVKVSMEAYVRDVLDLYSVTGYRLTPADSNLYVIDETLTTWEQTDQHDFLSEVMILMFVAQRARPDILTPVAFLSRRYNKVTSEDIGKLNRVLMYLNSYPDLAVALCIEGGMKLFAYVDAVHTDMRSHTGCVISMGRGPVHVSSKTQKHTKIHETKPS
jgi:hypothetical protein